MLWAMGLATGFGLDVKVSEADIWPLAVQGPKAEDLLVRLFGDEIREIRFFRSKIINYAAKEFLVARSGWSKQGGFEIYVNDAELGAQLWDELFAQGEELNVRAGCPNLIERIESGLLSFGGDMGYDTTPFECGLDKYVSLEADIESLSIDALRKRPAKTRLMGLVIDRQVKLKDLSLFSGGREIGVITSNTWSPKYHTHLGFAKCDINCIAETQELHVISSTGEVPARITELPFNFEALGLKSLNSK
jgi:dimethylsulfoniopropionate demethylase